MKLFLSCFLQGRIFKELEIQKKNKNEIVHSKHDYSFTFFFNPLSFIHLLCVPVENHFRMQVYFYTFLTHLHFCLHIGLRHMVLQVTLPNIITCLELFLQIYATFFALRCNFWRINFNSLIGSKLENETFIVKSEFYHLGRLVEMWHRKEKPEKFDYWSLIPICMSVS